MVRSEKKRSALDTYLLRLTAAVMLTREINVPGLSFGAEENDL